MDAILSGSKFHSWLALDIKLEFEKSFTVRKKHSTCLVFTISKIALVIIENGACWLVENFVLSRYNHC